MIKLLEEFHQKHLYLI